MARQKLLLCMPLAQSHCMVHARDLRMLSLFLRFVVIIAHKHGIASELQDQMQMRDDAELA
jgi:hypothetical protein